MPGPYIAKNYTAQKAVVDNGQCVRLVQVLAGAPNTSLWREGTKISQYVNALVLQPSAMVADGTAIATFINGRYPNLPSGNHAALFVRLIPGGKGIVVFDQWVGKLPGLREIYFGRPDSVGIAQQPEKFSVIL